jgi:hypothetical protein
MTMRPSVRQLAVGLGLVGVIALGALGAATAYRAATVSRDLCSWLNSRADTPLALRAGPETETVLARLRGAGAPVDCSSAASPYADSLFTETAIVLRPTRGPAVGLRIAPLRSSPAILGYWTP